MRVPILALAFLSSLLLVSCSQNNLASIKDPEALRKDCTALYQQFSITEDTNQIVKYGRSYKNRVFRKIPKENWPSSILALKPFDVDRDNFGICIWIKTNNPNLENLTIAGNWVAKGYFVSCDFKTIPPSIGMGGGGGRFFFKETEVNGIYEFKKPAAVE
jgi:hypothetical protein